MAEPRFHQFGAALREFLTEHGRLGKGLYRWFREEVGLEDRYLRRWMRGENLPSDDNWAHFVEVLRRQISTDAVSFEEGLSHVDQLLSDSREAPRKAAHQDNLVALIPVGDVPNGYIDWIAQIANSFSLNVQRRALANPLSSLCHLAIIVADRLLSTSETNSVVRLATELRRADVPLLILRGSNVTLDHDSWGESTIITLSQADDLAAVTSAMENVVRLSMRALHGADGDYHSIRRDVEIEVTISQPTVVTVAEITIESLVDSLDLVHHGVVIQDRSIEVDLNTSNVTVESLDPSRTITVEDLLPGKRTFQFAARIRPPIRKGQQYRYRYRHRCGNYFPLSREGVTARRNTGNYHLPNGMCEKAYTITAPTDRLLLRVLLGAGVARVMRASVEVATWKSDVIDESETRRLTNGRAVTLSRFQDQDRVELMINGPRLFARYRLLWEYQR